MTYSVYSPRAGTTRTPWLTGAAAWSYFSATQYILGLRPELGGLRMDPCIPSRWAGFFAQRRFRDNLYFITVHNPQHVCRGVVRMLVDGREADGNLVALSLPGSEQRVEVWLGN